MGIYIIVDVLQIYIQKLKTDSEIMDQYLNIQMFDRLFNLKIETIEVMKKNEVNLLKNIEQDFIHIERGIL